MLIKKERKKKRGGGLMDSLISAIFSETSKKLATSAAEAAIKTAANKGTERIFNSFGKDKKVERQTNGLIERISNRDIDIDMDEDIDRDRYIDRDIDRYRNRNRDKKVENIFRGTSIKFIK